MDYDDNVLHVSEVNKQVYKNASFFQFKTVLKVQGGTYPKVGAWIPGGSCMYPKYP